MKRVEKIPYNFLLSGFIAGWLIVMYYVFCKTDVAHNLVRFMCVSIYIIKCIFVFGLLYFQQLRVPEWRNLYSLNRKGVLATSLQNVLWLDVFGGLINLKPPPLDK